VLATVCYARTLEKISPQRVLLAGLTAGIAILCKHSGLIIGPVAIVILLWRLWEVNSLATIGLPKLSFQTSKLRIFIFLSLASIGSGLIALCVIWTAYGWRFTAANPDVGTFTQFQVEWVTVESGGLLSKSLIGFAREWRLLPEAFLFGMDFIIARSDRGGFLNGEISEHAHPLFYVWNFLYKTPFPALLLHIAGWVGILLAFIKYRVLINRHARALIILGLLYAAVLLLTSLNIGYRHAFPALYVSCLLASVTIAWTASMKSRSCFVLLALAISLFPMALANRDYYISYVNPFGGGREGGYKSLTDSSLDWGQDLPAAARFIEDWEKDNPDKPVYLASFGTALPSAYGIKTAQYLPFWGFRQREAYHPVLESGLYILSATALTLTYEPWTKDIELAYLGTKSAAVDLYERLRSGGNLSLDKARRNLNDAELRTLEDFEFLRCKRLVYYLHARSPDRIINGSMLAFVLGEEELEELGW